MITEINYKLPYFRIDEVFTTCSETVDWGLQLFHIPEIWEITQGSNIKIAILDTGCQLSHIDLQENIINYKNFTNEDEKDVTDRNGHGTATAGIIAAAKNNTGIIGVAPQAKLLIGKVLNDNGCGSITSILNGIKWAIDANADIINMSYGSLHDSKEIHDVIIYAAQKGVILIAAAGNEGILPTDSINYPAKYPEVVSVGAIDSNKQITKFCSRGSHLDSLAPGDQILSTYINNSYCTLSGTSEASPFCAGVAALYLSWCKLTNNTPKNFVDILHNSNTRVNDVAYGWGIINPLAIFQ